MPEITIDEEQMQQLITGAVLKTLDDKTKNDMIGQAIAHLISSSYGSGTVLMYAFKHAVEAAARTAIDEVLANSEVFQGRAKALIREALNSWLDETDKDPEKREAAARGLLRGIWDLR